MNEIALTLSIIYYYFFMFAARQNIYRGNKDDSHKSRVKTHDH